MPEPSILYLDRNIEKAVKLYDKGVSFEDFPADLKSLFDRWSIAHDINMKYHYKGADFVRGIYMIRFKVNETTARQDLRCAEMFFGKTKQSNRNYERILRIEALKKASYEAFAEKKYKEMASLEDPAHDPIDMPDWEDLRLAVQPNIEFNPELLEVERMPEDKVRQLWMSVQSRKKIDISDAEIIDTEIKKSPGKIEEENA
jgi:hypothetical protein